MKLLWLKDSELVSGQVYMSEDGSVSMYMGMSNTGRSSRPLFYPIGKAVSVWSGVKEKEMLWGKRQYNYFKDTLDFIINSPICEEVVSKTVTFGLYELDGVFVSEEMVAKWVRGSAYENIALSNSGYFDGRSCSPKPVTQKQLYDGYVYLLRRSRTGDFLHVLFVDVEYSNSTRNQLLIPIKDIKSFMRSPDDYVLQVLLEARNNGKFENAKSIYGLCAPERELWDIRVSDNVVSYVKDLDREFYKMSRMKCSGELMPF